MVAEKIARITNASGAAIGILEGQTIRYRAGAGAPALPLGSEVPLETAICAISVSTGQVLRTPDINMELLFDPDLCRKRQILSLVAVPIYHDGNIVGALELYFDRLQGFAEQDIQTCQLMAGLVSEAIGQGTESALKKSMAAERSAMLTAIEKLKPNLSALAEDQTPDIADKDARVGSGRGERAPSAGSAEMCLSNKSSFAASVALRALERAISPASRASLRRQCACSLPSVKPFLPTEASCLGIPRPRTPPKIRITWLNCSLYRSCRRILLCWNNQPAQARTRERLGCCHPLRRSAVR